MMILVAQICMTVILVLLTLSGLGKFLSWTEGKHISDGLETTIFVIYVSLIISIVVSVMGFITWGGMYLIWSIG